MIKKSIVIIFSIIQFNMIGQIGYLGKRFSVDVSANIPIYVVHNDLKLNFILGKKIEIFGLIGTSFNSKYYVQEDKDFYDIISYPKDQQYVGIDITNPLLYISNKVPYKTDLKLNVFYYGAGIRFYRKTHLAPIGHYVELQYSSLQAKPESDSLNWIVEDWDNNTHPYSEAFEKVSLHEIMIGLHRKRVFKGGWYFTSGLKVPLRWNNEFLEYANENTKLTLKTNKWFFQISLGKMLF